MVLITKMINRGVSKHDQLDHLHRTRSKTRIRIRGSGPHCAPCGLRATALEQCSAPVGNRSHKRRPTPATAGRLGVERYSTGEDAGATKTSGTEPGRYARRRVARVSGMPRISSSSPLPSCTPGAGMSWAAAPGARRWMMWMRTPGETRTAHDHWTSMGTGRPCASPRKTMRNPHRTPAGALWRALCFRSQGQFIGFGRLLRRRFPGVMLRDTLSEPG